MEIQAYIINISTREDRRIHIINEVSKLPFIKPTIVEGIVDGTGTCFQSQRKCIQNAKELQLEYVLVLEDDALFTDNCEEILKKSFLEIQNIEWDMLFLGANLFSPAYKVSEHLLKLTGAWCAHAYIVHNRFYDTILSLPPNKEMDTHYGELMDKHNVYISNPMIAYQLPSYSNLQNGFRDYNEAIDRNFLTYVKI
jgi:GR25 family glycosyltransferase involved in LPS biosynthesis